MSRRRFSAPTIGMERGGYSMKPRLASLDEDAEDSSAILARFKAADKEAKKLLAPAKPSFLTDIEKDLEDALGPAEPELVPEEKEAVQDEEFEVLDSEDADDTEGMKPDDDLSSGSILVQESVQETVIVEYNAGETIVIDEVQQVAVRTEKPSSLPDQMVEQQQQWQEQQHQPFLQQELMEQQLTLKYKHHVSEQENDSEQQMYPQRKLDQYLQDSGMSPTYDNERNPLQAIEPVSKIVAPHSSEYELEAIIDVEQTIEDELALVHDELTLASQQPRRPTVEISTQTVAESRTVAELVTSVSTELTLEMRQQVEKILAAEFARLDFAGNGLLRRTEAQRAIRQVGKQLLVQGVDVKIVEMELVDDEFHKIARMHNSKKVLTPSVTLLDLTVRCKELVQKAIQKPTSSEAPLTQKGVVAAISDELFDDEPHDFARLRRGSYFKSMREEPSSPLKRFSFSLEGKVRNRILKDEPNVALGTDFDLMELPIGASAGTIARCLEKSTAIWHLLQTIPKRCLQSRTDTAAIVREMKALEHPNRLSLLQCYEDERSLLMVFPFIDREVLLSAALHFSPAGSSMTSIESFASSVASQLLSLLKYLHSKGTCHLHLGLQYIEVRRNEMNEPLHVVVTGAGLWKLVSNAPKQGRNFADAMKGCTVPQLLTVAPEVLDGHGGTKGDIWSVGVLTFLMLSGHLPFDLKWQSATRQELHEVVCYGKLQWQHLNNVSNEAVSFCRHLLSGNSLDRPSAELAHSSRWISSSVANGICSMSMERRSLKQELNLLRNEMKSTSHSGDAWAVTVSEFNSLFNFRLQVLPDMTRRLVELFAPISISNKFTGLGAIGRTHTIPWNEFDTIIRDLNVSEADAARIDLVFRRSDGNVAILEFLHELLFHSEECWDEALWRAYEKLNNGQPIPRAKLQEASSDQSDESLLGRTLLTLAGQTCGALDEDGESLGFGSFREAALDLAAELGLGLSQL